MRGGGGHRMEGLIAPISFRTMSNHDSSLFNFTFPRCFFFSAVMKFERNCVRFNEMVIISSDNWRKEIGNVCEATRRVELEYEDSFLLTICVFFFQRKNENARETFIFYTWYLKKKEKNFFSRVFLWNVIRVWMNLESRKFSIVCCFRELFFTSGYCVVRVTLLCKVEIYKYSEFFFKLFFFFFCSRNSYSRVIIFEEISFERRCLSVYYFF